MHSSIGGSEIPKGFLVEIAYLGILISLDCSVYDELDIHFRHAQNHAFNIIGYEQYLFLTDSVIQKIDMEVLWLEIANSGYFLVHFYFKNII